MWKCLWIIVFTLADLLKHYMLNTSLLRGDAFHFKFISYHFQLLIHGKPLPLALWLPPHPVSCISHSPFISIFRALQWIRDTRFSWAQAFGHCSGRSVQMCVFSEAFCARAFPHLPFRRGGQLDMVEMPALASLGSSYISISFLEMVWVI